jgi:hypothetical protein
MCPVQWRPPAGRPQHVSFLRVRSCCAVAITDAPADYAVIGLHWQEAARQSVPCLGEDCRVHDAPYKVHAYTVLRFWSADRRTWVQAICDLGNATHDLATRDLRGRAVFIGREHPGKARGHLFYLRDVQAADDIPEPPEAKPVDPRPILMRRYGLFHEADYFETQPYVEQQRLAFPQDRKEDIGRDAS